MRSASRLAVCCLFAVAFTACATGTKVGARSAAVSTDLELARQAGGMTCAPKEIASAEANLAFAEMDVESGNPEGADAHVSTAVEEARRAVELCQVLPPPPKEQKRVIRPDRDGDGVYDDEDRCPDLAGSKENAGCPSMKDGDRDGLPDEVDRCPAQPEDRDGFEDEDGCPDPDNDKDGVADAVDFCPNEAGPAANRGCPVRDRDADGVADAVDKCPDQPGPAESNGCPDLDADKDGIADSADACPNEPGPANADPKRHGCPRAFANFTVGPEKLELKQPLVIDSERAKGFGKRTREVLDEVAQALKEDVKIRKLRVATSSGLFVGSSGTAQARAKAVRDYLVGKGVAADRIEAASRGPRLGVPANSAEFAIERE